MMSSGEPEIVSCLFKEMIVCVEHVLWYNNNNNNNNDNNNKNNGVS